MSARRFWIVCAAIFSLATAAQAQDVDITIAPPVLPTATPTATSTITPTPVPTLAVTLEGLFFDARAEVIFPAGIYFQAVILRAPQDIAALTLTIAQENRAMQTVIIDLELAELTPEGAAKVGYFWPIPNDQPPQLFSEIAFTWDVRSRFGESAQASGVIQFTDSRLIWRSRVDEQRRFDLTLPVGLSINALGQSLDAVYDLLAANTGQQPALNILLYDEAFPLNPCIEDADGRRVSAGPLTGVLVPCGDETLAERIISASGFTLVTGRAFVFSDAQDVLSDALFEAFYTPLWEGHSIPAWFEAGLRRVYRPTSNADQLAPALAAARSSTLYTLPQMQSGPPYGIEAQRLWEAQSFGMVLYIADTAGLETLYEIGRTLSSGQSFANIYQSAVGQPLERLIANWRDWLVSPRGQAAYRVSVYNPATPTPTASPTFTPFPPTRTPTPIPSVTPTPTTTLSPTPRPTLTSTPSVTPRPPGSLDTPTPMPAVTNAPLIDTGSQTSVVAFLLIVLAILVIAYTQVGRR